MSNVAAQRSFIYRPVDDHLVLKPTGVILWRLGKDVGFRNAGNYESATLTIEKEEEDVWSPQTPTRSKIATIYDDISVTLAFVLQQMDDIARAAAMQAEPKMVFDQPAANDQEFSFEDVEEGMILPLGVRQVTEIALPAAWIEGVNYQFDASAGHLEIIKFPAGVAAGTVAGTYSSAAIAARKVWGIANQLDLRGGVIFRGTNIRRNGPRQMAEFWDVGLRGDGEVPLGSNSSDQGSISIMGEVYADPTQPLEYQYGRVTDLPV